MLSVKRQMAIVGVTFVLISLTLYLV